MPVSARGVWTPADSDDWDLTVDLAAMATSIDVAISNGVTEAIAGAALPDTGWVSLSPEPGWVTGQQAGCRRLGGFVFIRGTLQNSSVTPSTSMITIATLPAGFYGTSIRGLAVSGFSPNAVSYLPARSIRIGNDGSIQYTPTVSGVTATGVFLDGSFLL